MKKKPGCTLSPGDIYAIPLSTDTRLYGYIKLYQPPDIGILNIFSKNSVLPLDMVKRQPEFIIVSRVGSMLESGLCEYIGNAPFTSDDASWAPPRRQIPPSWNKNIKMICIKGNFVPAKNSSEFDALPELLHFSDEQIKQFIESKIAKSEGSN